MFRFCQLLYEYNRISQEIQCSTNVHVFCFSFQILSIGRQLHYTCIYIKFILYRLYYMQTIYTSRAILHLHSTCVAKYMYVKMYMYTYIHVSQTYYIISHEDTVYLNYMKMI